MKSIEQVVARIKEIEGDSRYRDQPALVQVNAPLALIQVRLKSERQTLLWVMDNAR